VGVIKIIKNVMVNKIIIIEAKVKEAQEIRKLEEKVWGEDVVNKYDIPMFVRFGYVFVAKDKGKIIGAICSYFTKVGELYVCDWVVDKNYQGKKIGTDLYKALIKKSKHV
jgi:predicted N-acetyltransferase YhbS